MKMQNKNKLLVILAILFLYSCGINNERFLRYSKIKEHLAKQDPNGAVKFLDSKRADYSERELLLFYLDKGILSFYDRDYNTAITFLEKADVLQEELYTESVTANVSSYLLNDNVKKYQGDDYELIYINVFKALSYLELGDFEGAMVEVRKGQNKHKLFESRYQEELDEMKEEMSKDEDNVDISNIEMGDFSTVDSAILRLLGMILYRVEGESEDSQIDKNKLAELWKDYPQMYNFSTPEVDDFATTKSNEFVNVDIFALVGQSPQKLAWDLEVFSAGGALVISSNVPNRPFKMDAIPVLSSGNFNFSLSIPYLEEISSRIANVEIYVDNEFKSRMSVVEKVSNFAINDYEKTKTFNTIKSVMRAFTKAYAAHLATKSLTKEADPLVGLFASLATQALVSATEVADTRSWNLLNDSFYFSELKLPIGKYSVEVRYLDNNNNVINKYIKELDIQNTKKPKILISYGM